MLIASSVQLGLQIDPRSSGQHEDLFSFMKVKNIEIMTLNRTNPAASAQFAELLSGWNRETAPLTTVCNVWLNILNVI